MTPENLKTLLVNLDLSNSDLSTIAGVTERQVRSWINGTHKIPQSVNCILSAMDQKAISVDWLVNFVEQELRSRVD